MNVLQGAALERQPGIVHGFFTRNGGVSRGIYASLNCGLGSRDDPDRVRENLGRAARALGGEADRLVGVRQVHGRDVLVLTDQRLPSSRTPADALVSTRSGLLLAITGADCPSVLFADPGAGVVGAAHAGWRGAVGGVLDATVAAMRALGAGAGLMASVGPGIQQASYEVDRQLREPVLAEHPGNERFFLPGPASGKYFFDLGAYVEARLQRAGVREIERSRLDTCANPDQFFSYRRSTRCGEPDYGRQLAVIGLA